MWTYFPGELALAAMAAFATVQDDGDSGRELDAGAVTELADRFDEQSEQAARVADDIARARPEDVPDILRTAELNGVGTAWYARRSISDQTLGSAEQDSISIAERNQAVALLRKQSDSLGSYSQSLTALVISSGTNPELLQAAVDELRVPEAALIASGSPAAPTPNGEGAAPETAAPPSLAQLYVVGENGEATNDYPSVGAILIRKVNEELGTTREGVFCTGTLISPRVVVTAAHCVRGGRTPLAVFFQHAGRFAVTDHAVLDGFAVLPGSGQATNDLAVLQLEGPVLNIRPAAVAEPGTFEHGSMGTIVGFGYRNPLSSSGSALPGAILELTGIKLAGRVETRLCTGFPGIVVTDARICWEFKGANQVTVCSGDSGGPLFVRRGEEWILAGVTSFGYGGTGGGPCPASTIAVDTDLSVHRTWLQERIAAFDPAAPAPETTALQPVRNLDTRWLHRDFTRINPNIIPITSEPFPVKAGAGRLFVSVNGSEPDPRATTTTRVELIDPQGGVACTGDGRHSLAHCSAPLPAAGSWRIRITGVGGQELQLIALAY